MRKLVVCTCARCLAEEEEEKKNRKQLAVPLTYELKEEKKTIKTNVVCACTRAASFTEGENESSLEHTHRR